MKEFDRAHISYISSSARGIGDKPTDRSSYAKIHKLKKERYLCITRVPLNSLLQTYSNLFICFYDGDTPLNLNDKNAPLPWLPATL